MTAEAQEENLEMDAEESGTDLNEADEDAGESETVKSVLGEMTAEDWYNPSSRSGHLHMPAHTLPACFWIP